MMTNERIERLKAAGFRMGDAGDFLGLSRAEMEQVRGRLARPASDRFDEMVRRGAIDEKGRVLLRFPKG